MTRLRRIIAGGQTGVDQAALQAAIDGGLEHGGHCPPDRTSEAGSIPAHFELTPTPTERSPRAPHVPRSLRTEWNVRDANATLVLCLQRPAQWDAGTAWTIEAARRHGKPLLVLTLAEGGALERLRRWLDEHEIEVLNVAGPSESAAPGIGATTLRFLRRVLRAPP